MSDNNMRAIASNGNGTVQLVIAGVVLSGLYTVSLYSYLLFHSLAEGFSIAVAASIFMVAWNTRRLIKNKYILFLGIAFLFIGFVDMLHAIAYKGMGVFPDYDANRATQLWIAARYLNAFTLLIAPIFLRRGLNPVLTLWAYVIVTTALLVSVFGGIFPDCFIEGSGLTPFKRISEYVICFILAASLWLLRRNKSLLDTAVLRWLTVSILAMIITELSFTFYVSVYGFSNLVGHFFKITAFYLIYKALIETGLKQPFALLFRELKQSEKALTAERDFTSAVLDTEASLLIVLDRKGRIVRFNHACETLTGYSFSEVRDGAFFDLVIPPDEAKPTEDAFGKLLTGGDIGAFENRWLTKSGERRLISWSTSTLSGTDGEVQYIIGSGIDITEQRRAEDALRQTIADKEMLVREVHHRVKNNLAVISSLLSLQSRQLHDAEAMDMFKETETRLKSISMIHERLYKASTLSSINISEYIRSLSTLLFNTYRPKTGYISLGYDVQELNLDVEYLLPCGLILNELISNAFKHAFLSGDGNTGSLAVGFSLSDGLYRLSVRDNGKGLPEGFDIERTDSLGMKIVQSLTTQLQGKLEIISGKEGTEFRVSFKEKPIF